MSSDPRRTRFFALLGQDQLLERFYSLSDFEPGLLYLHLLSLPAPCWHEDTVEYADWQQLVETLNAEETISFLCARIEEVWQLTVHLQTLLRAVPYSQLFAQGWVNEPLRDELLTKAMRSLFKQDASFTPELTDRFLQLLTDEFARQWIGNTLFVHTKQELRYIAQARFLHRSLTQDGASLSPLRQALRQLEERGLIVQEAAPAQGAVRLRILPARPVLEE